MRRTKCQPRIVAPNANYESSLHSKFYLTGFTDPTTPDHYDPFLHVFNLDMGEWDRASPKNTARIIDYYDVILDSAEKHNDLESALSKLENCAAKLIRGKLAAAEELSETERVHFSEFIASMAARVPVSQAATAGRMAEEGQALLSELCDAAQKDPKLLQRIKDDIKAKTGREIASEFGIDELNIDDFEVEATRNAVIVRSFQGMQAAVRYVAAMNWHFLRATNGDEFVTSDAPVAVLSRAGGICSSYADLKRVDIELTMPVTGAWPCLPRQNGSALITELRIMPASWNQPPNCVQCHCFIQLHKESDWHP